MSDIENDTQAPSNEFEDFLQRRLQQDEEEELEMMLGEDTGAEINNFSESELDSSLDVKSDSILQKETSYSENIDKKSSTDSKKENISNKSSTSSRDVIVMEWKPDSELDLQDPHYQEFHEKIKQLIKISKKDEVSNETKSEFAYSIVSSGAKKVGNVVRNVGSVVGSLSGRFSTTKAEENSSSLNTNSNSNSNTNLNPNPNTNSNNQVDSTTEIVETRFSIFLSDLLSNLPRIVETPNQEQLANKRDEAQKSSPGFDSLRNSLKNKIVLLECTVDNISKTLSDCINKNIRLGKQNEKFGQNIKYIKSQFLEQQKEIQLKDQEIRNLKEKLSQLNQIANRYKAKLQSYENSVPDQNNDIQTSSTPSSLTTNDSSDSHPAPTLVNSFMSWIGKRENTSNEVQGPIQPNPSNTTSFSSWFKGSS